MVDEIHDLYNRIIYLCEVVLMSAKIELSIKSCRVNSK